MQQGTRDSKYRSLEHQQARDLLHIAMWLWLWLWLWSWWSEVSNESSSIVDHSLIRSLHATSHTHTPQTDAHLALTLAPSLTLAR